MAALRALGVQVVFGLPGVHNMAAWRALEAADDIRLVCVRHEQAAAYAADGYARATGRLGVALVTTGPGAANTLGAVGEAHACHSPILVIATATPQALRIDGVNRGALHETPDQLALFAPLTVARARVEDAAKLAPVVTTLAARPQGPVYLEIPTDLLTASVPSAQPAPPRGGSHTAGPSVDPLIAQARRPLIWAGGGAIDAGAEVAALADRLGAPILTTFGARGIAHTSPHLVGVPPHTPQAGALWDTADLVISVGSDLDGVDTQNWRQPQPPVLIAVNRDAADATKNYRADAVLVGDAATGCRVLARGEARAPWADAQQVTAQARAEIPPPEREFLDSFAHAIPDEAIVVCDMCIPGYWLAGFHPVPGPRRLQVPLGWGTLGYAFPASLGAAQAGPTIAVCGDGGFLFAAGELATVAQEQPDLTILVVDDGGYGMLGTPLTGVPDFVALAASFGIEGEYVDGLGAAFEQALARQVAARGPSLIHARAKLTPPPTTSPHWYRPAP